MENIVNILNDIEFELPFEEKAILDKCNEFYEKFGNINNDVLNESLQLLNDYYNTNIKPLIEVEPVKAPINRVVSEEINYFERYKLQGMNIPEKIKICKLIHEYLGFPARFEKLIDFGKRRLKKTINEQVEYSESTIYDLINIVLKIDNTI